MGLAVSCQLDQPECSRALISGAAFRNLSEHDGQRAQAEQGDDNDLCNSACVCPFRFRRQFSSDFRDNELSVAAQSSIAVLALHHVVFAI